MAPLTCPVCAAPVRQGDLICINCGANLARREPPPQQYPPQDQPAGQYPPQDQYAPQQQYPSQQDQYPPQQQQGGYPPQQDYQQQQYPPQQGGGGQYPPQQQYPQQDQQRQSPYQQQDQYAPQQDQYGSPPQQDQYGPPPQQDRQAYGAPQQQGGYGQQQPQQQQFPPQQQQQQQQGGYGGGYGAPHMQPPPREPTMTGGESTAAFTPFCPHCGAEIPDVGNPVCVQCLRPLHDQGGGHGGPQQLSMFVQFSSGELQVNAGQELVLGRDPVHSPVANTFSRFDNVSRRHATLGIDGTGQGWIRDERSTNGTFVNDRRLQPGEQASLRDGDSIRLAADARGQIRLGR